MIEAEAGAKLIDTTHVALHHSLKGFEFASGIPGSVGGAVFMNAGSLWGEIAHVPSKYPVRILTKDREIETLSASELAFGYRHSKIQETGAVVISAKICFVTRQSRANPLGDGSVDPSSSVETTLNTLLLVDLSSAVLSVILQVNSISAAGLKGYRIGGVEVSEKHAGFMVNVDNGTAKDYRRPDRPCYSGR